MNRSPCGGGLMLRLAAAQRDQAVDAVDLVRRASRAGQQGALDVALGRTRLDAAQLDAAAVQRDVAQLFRQRLGLRRQRHLPLAARALRSDEHTSELQSLMRISYAVFCLKKKNTDISTAKTTT